MTDQTQIIETAVIERLSHVIDPELGRSVTDLGMICGVDVRPTGLDSFNVRVNVELTVPGCPLSAEISRQIEAAVTSYAEAQLTAEIVVGAMDEEKLKSLVNDLKAARRENPFSKPGYENAHLRHRLRQGWRGKVFHLRQSCGHVRRTRLRHRGHRRRYLRLLAPPASSASTTSPRI